MDEKTRKTLAEEAQALQHKAGKTKTKYKTLHRGMVLNMEDARSMFTPNSTYTFDTLTSTATDRGVASIYTNVENMAIENGVPVMIEIQKPDGIYGFDRDGMEVLLPKGSEFKVTRNWMDKDGVVHVSMYSKKGNNVLKSDDIPFIDSKKVNLTEASDDWFEYENAQFMREAVRTGTVPVVTPDGSILPGGGDDNGGDGSDKKSKTAGVVLTRLEKKIHKVYDIASKEVQAKLDDYMRRFKIKDEIKLRALKQGLITEAEYKQWRTGQIMIGKRWEEMQTVLAQDLTNANRIAASMINDHTPDAYAIGSNYAAFEVEAGSMLNTSFTLYDRYTVERLVKENPKLLPKARVNIPKDLRWNKQKLNSAITQGILQGENLDKVSRRLQSVTDMNRHSAVRNARTMMTSAENGGRFNSYLRAEDLGINMEKQWLATLDGRTRHSHAAQDGEHVPIKEEFSNGLMFPADPDGDPREVYNCFVADTTVAVDSDIIRTYKHRYTGELVSIETASGVKFTCTPNHPILTPSGWIGANTFNEGDDILIASIGDEILSGRNPDVYHVFPGFDTLHNLVNKVGSKRVRVLGVNFHGDIPASDVEIITKKCFLRSNRDSSVGQRIYKLLFVLANKAFVRKCSFMEHLRAIRATTLGFISGKSKAFPFFGGKLSHSGIHGFGLSTDVDLVLPEYTINDLPAEAVVGGECLDGLTGKVFVDKVVAVKISTSDCHVYNLQSENNYYFVNNIIHQNGTKYNGNFAVVHNCRCTMVAVVGETDPTVNPSEVYRDSRLEDIDYEDWLEEHMEEM